MPEVDMFLEIYACLG